MFPFPPSSRFSSTTSVPGAAWDKWARGKGVSPRIQANDTRYNRPHAPVAQWIEQPPPKGQVGRSIRLRGATDMQCHRSERLLCPDTCAITVLGRAASGAIKLVAFPTGRLALPHSGSAWPATIRKKCRPHLPSCPCSRASASRSSPARIQSQYPLQSGRRMAKNLIARVIRYRRPYDVTFNEYCWTFFSKVSRSNGFRITSVAPASRHLSITACSPRPVSIRTGIPA